MKKSLTVLFANYEKLSVQLEMANKNILQMENQIIIQMAKKEVTPPRKPETQVMIPTGTHKPIQTGKATVRSATEAQTIHNALGNDVIDATKEKEITEKNQRTELPNEGRNTQLGWPEKARATKPEIRTVPKTIAGREKDGPLKLEVSTAIYSLEPEPMTEYFQALQRGPVGNVINELRECVPTRALLGTMFVGGSVVEIITDGRLEDRLAATLRMMNIIKNKILDIFEKPKRQQASERAEGISRTDIEEMINVV